ncbi:MAG: Smr/MutS family protein [Desulfovibrio sp.]|jgi:DNA-nicking Smr family endonuclease|nr:Smr/MutS family protein [Desulfovibrio sp.]
MEEGFADNPFRNLDRNRFPQAGEPSAEVTVRKKDRRSPPPEPKRPPALKPVKADTPKSADPPPEEETALFSLAMDNVNPLPGGRGRSIIPEPPPASPPPPVDAPLEEAIQRTLEFALIFSEEHMEAQVKGLDMAVMSRLRAGSYSPEAHLDLHGLNVLQAFYALRDFMKGAWYKGLRTVLVVTGRGKNSPNQQGVLREKLQDWLTQDPFKRVLLAYCTAKPSDGGPGSVYVLLRKNRKTGKVCWEKVPADIDLLP